MKTNAFSFRNRPGFWFLVSGFWILAATAAFSQVPQQLSYEGRLLVGTTNFNGTGQFKFAFVNSAGNTCYWSNDGSLSLTPGALTPSAQPTNAVSLTVTNGLYQVLLGNTALTNMTALPSSVFSANSGVYLRVWFNDGVHGSQLLSPDQQISSVGYAMVAAGVPSGAITSSMMANGAVGSSQLAAGAVQTSNIAIAAVGSSQLATNLTIAGTTTSTFSGDGLALTNLNANNIATGTLAPARLPNNVALLSAPTNTYAGTQVLPQNGLVVGTSQLVLAGGKVGIGTIAPIAPLDVGGSGWFRADNGAALASSAANGVRVFYDSVNSVGAMNAYNYGTGGGPLPLVLQETGGKAGIGTIAPIAALDVGGSGWFRGDSGALSSSASKGVRVFYDTTDLVGQVSAYDYGAGAPLNLILQQNGGNVGIGTTAPVAPLDVAGNGCWFRASSFAALPASASKGVQVACDSSNGYIIAFDYGAGAALNLALQPFGGNVGIGTGFVAPTHPLQMQGGAYCTGTTWTNSSDRNVKEAFTAISPAEVLAKVAALPVTQWKYKIEPDGIKHIGPVAQDFHAAFGLGDSDLAIGTVDEGGVALAAIQGLNEKLEAQRQKLEAQRTENARLEADNAAMKQRVAELESKDKEREARLTRLESLLPPATLPAAAKTANKSK